MVAVYGEAHQLVTSIDTQIDEARATRDAGKPAWAFAKAQH